MLRPTTLPRAQGILVHLDAQRFLFVSRFHASGTSYAGTFDNPAHTDACRLVVRDLRRVLDWRHD